MQNKKGALTNKLKLYLQLLGDFQKYKQNPKENDKIFVRKDYSLYRKLYNKGWKDNLQCDIKCWENGNEKCPICGESKFKDLDADIWADWKPPFCPNCGANMGNE